MDKIEKAVKRLSQKEKGWLKAILKQLSVGDFRGLDITKLRGRGDIFRVRKGDVRIIYRKDAMGGIFILKIDRRKETTYNFD